MSFALTRASRRLMRSVRSMLTRTVRMNRFSRQTVALSGVRFRRLVADELTLALGAVITLLELHPFHFGLGALQTLLKSRGRPSIAG
jgi:hypothetical protein